MLEDLVQIDEGVGSRVFSFPSCALSCDLPAVCTFHFLEAASVAPRVFHSVCVKGVCSGNSGPDSPFHLFAVRSSRCVPALIAHQLRRGDGGVGQEEAPTYCVMLWTASLEPVSS